MDDCVYLTDYDGQRVCGHADSINVQIECIKCNLYMTKDEACPHLGGCGHGGDGMNGCKKDVYCSYRSIRFHDGPEMPDNMRQKIRKLIEGR